MRASQVLVGSEGPDGPAVAGSLSEHVLIGTDTLATLRARVDALGSQCTQLQQRVRALKREAHTRAREVEQKQRVLATEEAHCREVQLLKFGQTVQLEALGQRPEEHADAQLKRKVRWIEELGERKTRQWEKRVRDAGDELLRATEENTALLEKAGRLRELQHQVERSLNTQTQQLHNSQRHGQAVLGGAGRGAQQQVAALTETLQRNEASIDALKAELLALKSKQGRVYAPGQG
jgi:predicted RNase H-like nuclease (RuvC/YqgF family)